MQVSSKIKKDPEEGILFIICKNNMTFTFGQSTIVKRLLRQVFPIGP